MIAAEHLRRTHPRPGRDPLSDTLHDTSVHEDRSAHAIAIVTVLLAFCLEDAQVQRDDMSGQVLSRQ